MIELFDSIKKQREKSIKIQCGHMSYWRSDSDLIKELVEYIKSNINNFCIETFEIKENTIYDTNYIQSFDIVIYTNTETYNHISNKYNTLLEKYDKYTIDLTGIEFYPLSSNHKLNLR